VVVIFKKTKSGVSSRYLNWEFEKIYKINRSSLTAMCNTLSTTTAIELTIAHSLYSSHSSKTRCGGVGGRAKSRIFAKLANSDSH
jgi:hypothetical protein